MTKLFTDAQNKLVKDLKNIQEILENVYREDETFPTYDGAIKYLEDKGFIYHGADHFVEHGEVSIWDRDRRKTEGTFHEGMIKEKAANLFAVRITNEEF